MSWLNHLSMRGKLLVLILPALLTLAGFAALSLFTTWQDHRHTRDTLALTRLAEAADPVIEDLQKERGLTALMLASGSADGRAVDRLAEQRLALDTSLAGFLEQLPQREADLPEGSPVHAHLQTVRQKLTTLEDLRRRTDTGNPSVGEATAAYSDLIMTLAGMIPEVLRDATGGGLARQLSGYYALTMAAEWAGRERASGAAIIRSADDDPAALSALSRLVGKQAALLDTAAELLGPEAAGGLGVLADDDANQRFTAQREQLLTQKFGYIGLGGLEWFDLATARIDLLYRFKGGIVDDMLTQARQTLDGARYRLGVLAAVTLVALAVCLLLALMIIGSASRQVGTLLDDINNVITRRDLTTRTTVVTRDETGRIGTAINQLLATFADAITRIDQASVQLATASDQTSTAAAQSSARVHDQQALVEQSATATEEMAATAAEISANTQNVAEAAVRATERNARGQQVVTESLTRVDELSRSIRSLSDVMDELLARSETITGVVDVIKTVADQTSLLALNAAIEAARAGSHGRGFAVVADEVRNLASKTQDSTDEIDTIIGRFRTLTEEAHRAIRQSHQHAEETAGQSRELETTFADINTDVARISEMATQIAAAAEEQVSVSQEISRGMETVRGMSQETLDGAREIGHVTREQAELAGELRELSGRFAT